MVAAVAAALGDLEDLLLGAIELLEGVGGIGITVGDRLHRGGDQPALQCFLENDTRMVLDICSGRRAHVELGEVVRSADIGELPDLPELVVERDDIDRLVPLRQRNHRRIDQAVRLAVEALGRKNLDNLAACLAVEHHGAENGHFGIVRIRRNAVGGALVEVDNLLLATAPQHRFQRVRVGALPFVYYAATCNHGCLFSTAE